MRRFLAVAVFLALSQGCAVAPQPPSPTFARPPDLAPIEAKGPYLHEPSHAMVPDDFAGFHRVSLFRRGPDGQRLTVSYARQDLPDCPVAITVFLDPMDPAGGVDDAYAKAKEEVTHAFPSAVLEREESRNDQALTGRRGFFRIDDTRMEVGVVVAQKSWYVKHRVMFPARCAEQVRDAVSGFFPGWPH